MNSQISPSASEENLRLDLQSHAGDVKASCSRLMQSEDENVHSPPSSTAMEDPSPLEYARMTGLTMDFTTENPFCSIKHQADAMTDLSDPDGALRLDSSLHCFPTERLEIAKDALAMLQSALVPPDPAFLLSPPSGKSPILNLRVGLPLLETDHELDILHFGSRHVPDFQNINIPFQHGDKEQDESLEWPSNSLCLIDICMNKVETEKLEIEKHGEGMSYLLELLRPPNVDAEMDAIFAEEATYVGTIKKILLTPPLLPISSPFTAFEPSVEASNFPLLSDETNSTLAEAQALEFHLAKQDSITFQEIASESSTLHNSTDEFDRICGPLLSVISSNPTTPPLKRKPSASRVEVPLLPNLSSSCSSKRLKTVSFPEILHNYTSEPLNQKINLNNSTSQESLDAFFAEVIQPITDEVNHAIEQEQLQEADALLRVDVPVLKFTQLIPPWKVYSRASKGKHPEGQRESDAQRRLLIEVRHEGFGQFAHWPGVSKLDRLVASWTPFPLVNGIAVLNEVIEDADYMASILECMSLEDVVVSDSLTWKPEGLRILDDLNATDDELEPAVIEEEDGRKWFPHLVENMRQGDNDGQPSKAEVYEVSPSTRWSHTHSNPKRRHQQRLASETSSHLPEDAPSKIQSYVMGNGTFSTTAALSNFMHIMGKQSMIATKPIGESQFDRAATIAPVAMQRPAPGPIAVTNQSPQVENKPHPGPSIPSQLPARSFIIATSLLQDNRRLVREIKQLYKNAELLERDFPSIPTAFEADILLSATTGLLVTTLQKIHQRSLPGQKAKSGGLKERILHLSIKYERIIVYVSEGLVASGDSYSSKEIEQRDCDSLAELSGFGASLAAFVQITYVAGGNEELARWIVAAMVQYGIDSNESQLLEVETLWEQVLRRAGFNAYAAQIILVNLKEPNIDGRLPEVESSETAIKTLATPYFGLRAFMRMDFGDRIRRFEGLLGGCRVLQKVNEVLEQGWLSASNDFQAKV